MIDPHPLPHGGRAATRGEAAEDGARERCGECDERVREGAERAAALDTQAITLTAVVHRLDPPTRPTAGGAGGLRMSR